MLGRSDFIRIIQLQPHFKAAVYAETPLVLLKLRAAILGGCSVNLCYDVECAHLLCSKL